MERLNRDELILIAMNLDYPEILSLCNSHPRNNQAICRNDTFWFNKLRRDFPNYQAFNIDGTHRDIYKKIYGISDIKRKWRLDGSLLDIYNTQKLYLSRNQIREIPETIGNLSNLRGLWLDNNQISIIPESIGNLSNLHILSSAHNQITEVPRTIGNLSNLRGLNLSDNQIREVPESIGNLSNLQFLNLSNNQIREVPESVSQLMERRPDPRIRFMMKEPIISRIIGRPDIVL